MKHLRAPALLAGAMLSALAPRPSSAQTPLYTLNGTHALQHYGSAVAGVGDADGDGHEDFLVGTPTEGGPGQTTGAIHLVSGRTGETLLHILGPHVGDWLGAAVSAAPDLDGDGRGDLAAGAINWKHEGIDCGAVLVFSSATGALLRTIVPPAPDQYARFGSSVALLGDVDHDGVDDLAIGAPNQDNWAGVDSGMAYVYSGATNAVLCQLYGTTLDELGRCVAPAGDFDGDGWADLALGIPLWSPPTDPYVEYGKAVVWSVHKATALAVWSGAPGECLGWSLAGVGDVTGDGLDDLLLGAPYNSDWGTYAGKAYLRAGGSGALVYQMIGTSGSRFGSSLAALGDVDGDARGDYAIGATGYAPNWLGPVGRVQVRSGAAGAVLATLVGSGIGDEMGSCVSGADLNGDGLNDLVAGAPFAEDASGLLSAGEVRALLLDAPAPHVYCGAKTNSLGCTPRIGWSGIPSVSTLDDFHVRASNVRSHQPGQLFWGLASANLPFQGGTLCVAAPRVRTSVQTSTGPGGDCSGTYDFHFSGTYAASRGVTPGTHVFAQYWTRDPGDAFGTGLTDALEFTLLP